MNWVDVPCRVAAEFERWRLDRWLARRLRRVSRARAQELIREGRVLARGRRVRAAMPVRAGETVTVLFERRPDPEPERRGLTVLYEDDRLLAVDKPPGLLSHPTDKTVKASVVWLLARQFPGLRPRLAHRLDRETSGVLLISKDAAAAKAAAEAFTERRVRKEYLAIARGAPSFSRRRVSAAIAGAGGEIRVRRAVTPSGESAVTELEVLSRAPAAAVLRAVPMTGRLHQIRVHLAWLGHPVLGDKLYTGAGEAYLKAWAGSLGAGDWTALGAPRQMLHAAALELPHPGGGRRLRIESPLPADFREALRGLRLRYVEAQEAADPPGACPIAARVLSQRLSRSRSERSS